MTRQQWVLLLIGLPAFGHMAGYIPAAMEHVNDTAHWIDHARFHAFQTILLVSGWDLLVLGVLWKPFRQRQAWTLWVFVIYFIFVQMGYFMSVAAIPAGTPPEFIFNVLFGVALLMVGAGTYLAWQELKASPV